MLIAISVLAAFVPMFLYLFLIWKFDQYEREPFKLVLQSYLWGAFGAVFISILFSGFLSTGISLIISNKNDLNLIDAVYIAPFVEEITKGIFLLILVTSKKFDNVTDGLVYGGAIGLGFGMTENFLYFITYGHTYSQLFSLIIVRTLFSAVMHCVSTGTFGAFLGYAKFNKPVYKIILVFTGLGSAVFIHFFWNLSVGFRSSAGIGFLFLLLIVLTFIGVYVFSILSEKKIIYKELLPETQTGVIPLEHLKILNSPKRNKPGWVDESIRKLYIKEVTTLAFRKLQYKNSFGFRKKIYEKDIDYYRERVKDLLNKDILKL